MAPMSCVPHLMRNVSVETFFLGVAFMSCDRLDVELHVVAELPNPLARVEPELLEL